MVTLIIEDIITFCSQQNLNFKRSIDLEECWGRGVEGKFWTSYGSVGEPESTNSNFESFILVLHFHYKNVWIHYSTANDMPF